MLSTQVISDQAMKTWRRFLRAQCGLMRRLDAELTSQHGLTINDYDVLVQLRDAPDGQMRMSALASHTLLTRSGITRLIDGLVRDGIVERRPCSTDARVAYARLTPAGVEKMLVAKESHLASVDNAFTGLFDEQELAQLGEYLGRLPGVLDVETETSNHNECG